MTAFFKDKEFKSKLTKIALSAASSHAWNPLPTLPRNSKHYCLYIRQGGGEKPGGYGPARPATYQGCKLILEPLENNQLAKLRTRNRARCLHRQNSSSEERCIIIYQKILAKNGQLIVRRLRGEGGGENMKNPCQHAPASNRSPSTHTHARTYTHTRHQNAHPTKTTKKSFRGGAFPVSSISHPDLLPACLFLLSLSLSLALFLSCSVL